MRKKQNKPSIERKVAKLEKELEPKIVRAICEQLGVGQDCEGLTLDDVRRISGYYMGFCHLIWENKKQILMDDYSIDWMTPAELEPHVQFD